MTDFKKFGKFIRKCDILTISMLAGACLTLLTASFSAFAQSCEALQGEVLRLHILPNSNSADDQQLKYELRDFILSDAKTYFADVSTLEEAVQSAQYYLSSIEENAKAFIAEKGYDYDVIVSIETMFFTTRVYENLTMPAGDYTALRIKIGEGEGQNWWCVAFPPLCLPAVTQKSGEPYFSPETSKVIEADGKRAEVKFKLYEWLKQKRSNSS
ncbi:MAG: stage II sporulation protein R [Oscillospiraceae bacterium]|nr:stage II sporulation protein R [Oscillospiraceae bacterium]